MKKYALLAAIVFIASSAGVATAYFGNAEDKNIDKPRFENHEEMFAKKIESLGLDLTEVQTQLEEGKTLKEVISEAGITKEDMLESKKALMIEHVNQLVADGKITQETADKKITWMEERMTEKQENCTEEGGPLFKRDGSGGKGMKIRSLK